MKVISLQSGSNGNCIYVESGGVRLMFDAGISGRQAELRLAEHGRDIQSVDALLISHDHRDHTNCMGIYHRKYGLPLYITEKTLAVTDRKMKLGRLQQIQHFRQSNALCFGDVTVETIATPHDGVEGVGFVVDDGRRRLGILTDLGHVFSDLRGVLSTLDAVLLESNYDPGMLARSDYPQMLKARIRSQSGHLSNRESAELLASTANGRLQWACLAHLSEQNNDPQLALRTHRQILGPDLPLFVASRYRVSDVLSIA